MQRGHRSAHRFLWVVLTIAVASGFTLALLWRKPQPKPTAVSPNAITQSVAQDKANAL